MATRKQLFASISERLLYYYGEQIQQSGSAYGIGVMPVGFPDVQFDEHKVLDRLFDLVAKNSVMAQYGNTTELTHHILRKKHFSDLYSYRLSPDVKKRIYRAKSVFDLEPFPVKFIFLETSYIFTLQFRRHRDTNGWETARIDILDIQRRI